MMNIEYPYRIELKKKILIAARSMFFKDGIRKVKMDDIANHLKISKRTLYEIYDNKEVLLHGVLQLNEEEHLKRLKAFDTPGTNVINIIIEAFNLKTQEVSAINPAFYEDISRYPSLIEKIRERKQKQAGQTKEFVKRGIEEGYFLPNIKIEILMQLADASVHFVMSQQLYKTYSMKDIFYTYIMVYARGICTLKGIELIEQYLEELDQK